jgi:hypothetical protein
MNDFDYLNGTLTQWLDEWVGDDSETIIQFIEQEYLPRFEKAIHENASRHAVLK